MKRTYFTLLLPAVLLTAALYGLKTWGSIPAFFRRAELVGWVSPAIFVLSALFAVALPILYRSTFAHRMRNEKAVPETTWVRFERNLMRIALVAPYLLFPAVLFGLPRFFLAGTVLMALYAVYYFFPSQKRMRFERRLFRVKGEGLR